MMNLKYFKKHHWGLLLDVKQTGPEFEKMLYDLADKMSNMKASELHLSRSSPDRFHISFRTRGFMLSSEQ